MLTLVELTHGLQGGKYHWSGRSDQLDRLSLTFSQKFALELVLLVFIVHNNFLMYFLHTTASSPRNIMCYSDLPMRVPSIVPSHCTHYRPWVQEHHESLRRCSSWNGIPRTV